MMSKYCFVLFVLLLGFVSSEAFGNTAATSSFSSVNSYQYTNPSFTNLYSASDINTYWPQLSEDIANNKCYGNTDFLVMIPPAGCTPSVIRSDLLAEQNVPVFCQLESAKVNPLIKVSSIKSISFKGKYPAEIAGVSYYPSKSALRSYTTLLGSPVVNNIGYVVIILKKQSNETASPKNVSGNLTATLYYDAEKAFGVGSSEFYLEEMSDARWETDKYLQSFWQGRGLLRVTDVQNDRATIQVLSQDGNVIRTETLNTGSTGGLFYFPGFYCRAALKLKLNDIDSPEDSVILSIDGVQMEARRGTKLANTGCRVTSLNVFAGDTGTVKVSCGGKVLDLSLLNMYNANFSLGTAESRSYSLATNVKNNYYMAYAGVTKKNIGNIAAGREFVVLLNSSFIPENKIYSELTNNIDNTFNYNTGSELALDFFKTKIAPSKFSGKNVVVLFKDDNGIENKEGDVVFNGLLTSEGKEVVSDSTQQTKELAAGYFDSGDITLQELLKEYSAMTNTTGSNYGETGLYEEIELTKRLQQKGLDYGAKKLELMNQFLELYPQSEYAEGMRQDLTIAQRTDSTNAYKSVFSNNEYHSVGVVRFKPAELGAKSFELVVNNQNARNIVGDTIWHEGDTINLSKTARIADTNDYLVVKTINAKSVSFDYYSKKNSKDSNSSLVGTPILQFSSDSNIAVEPTKLKSGEKADAYGIYLSDVKVEKIAYVSIVSDLKTSSEANFTFNIGIEQRAIELSPAKAQSEADELNKTIKEWEDKNAKLGKLVESWKAVCLSTGLFMQVKNLVTGFSGQSLARQNVMQVYKGICKTKVPSEYPTIDACYNFYADSISKDVDAYTAAIKNIDENIKTYEGNLTKFQQNSSACSYTIEGRGTVGSAQMYSWADVRQCLLYQQLGNSGAISADLKADLKADTTAQFGIIAGEIADSTNVAKLKDELPVGLKDTYTEVVSSRQEILVAKPVSMSKEELLNTVNDNANLLSVLEDFQANEKIGVTTTHIGIQWYLFISKSDGLKQSYKFSTNNGEKIFIDSATNGDVSIGKTQIKFNVVSEKKCLNNYTAPTIIYYDSEPNKGMPAIVPIDLKEGWYVFIPQSAGSNIVVNAVGANQAVAGITGQAIQGYTAAGEVSYFWLCNVGANGRMEQRQGDDICQSFNVNNANYEGFSDCGMTTTKVKALVTKAISTIRFAASQYKNGVTGVVLPGVGDVAVEPGSVSDYSAVQCQDFMSPQDCKIMYNVCDPVICPSSRCNFGGKMPVANVIQSGIIGSTILCLKNFVGFGGDVYVPVCLTGIHAGIEGYVSILKAQQSCLQEYAKSGKHVGICDEITAIYKCEFFWRQVSPLMQNIVPSLAELVYTGSWNKQTSGGEYATFQSSWNNMQKSIDYFKNTYASTSFTAYKFGNVEEIGSTYCRNFLGTSLPTSGKAIDSLLKPESPAQFYGKFSSVLFTGVTVPSTSQYKVFYHIYAGTDIGASYTVYLKDPQSISYYSTPQQVHVKSGYLAKGEQATESVDFTAPTGYKQLCLLVNDQEECGFQSVSTDFAVNALHDLYAQEQGAANNITTENECISGSSSLLALANTNVQAGVEEAVNPDISLRGIIRVCAKQNPGSGTSSTNWQNVGYCGDKSLTCWLDKSSLVDAQNVLGKVGSVSNAIEALSVDSKTAKLNSDQEKTSEQLAQLRKNISDFSLSSDEKNENIIKLKVNLLVQQADEVFSGANLDWHKAEALYLRAQLYYKIVREVLNIGVSKSENSGSGSVSGSAPAASAIDSSSGSSSMTTPTDNTKIVARKSGNNFVIYNGDIFSGYTLNQSGSASTWKLYHDNSFNFIDNGEPFSLSEEIICTFDGSVLKC